LAATTGVPTPWALASAIVPGHLEQRNGLASRLKARKAVAALSRQRLKAQGKRSSAPYPATYTAGETKATQCNDRLRPVLEIVHDVWGSAGSSPPQLPSTPLTTSGDQDHLPATLVHPVWLGDQEGEVMRPQLRRKCMTPDLQQNNPKKQMA
jgi:hypothetical protein